ncbi:MAG: type IVB secretion system protein IcmH/DotU [Betaproteobacteria bacterium]|nr:type IVB secretion system protein IcmH/DotU [Betaproteobacteria bacterium]
MLGDTQMSGAMRASLPEPEYNRAGGVNPLVWAANRLLDMIAQIRGTHQLGDPAKLRERLVLEINHFEQRAQSVGVPREDLIGARYCLCTVLDEVAAMTPWGSNGVWAKQGLLVSFHNETWGGEKYYQLLARLAQNPERHKDLIELLYYCNALGFEGRFRVENNGYSQLEQLKRRIATILANCRGGYENRLSPHWQGVSSTPPAWRLIPPWVVAMLCALIGMGIYIVFLFSLGDRMNVTSANLNSLKIPALAVEKPAPLPTPPVVESLCVQLTRRMDGSLVTVTPYEGHCVVTLKGDELFGSGSATIRTAYLDVINGVADAVRDVKVEAIVMGHTDNIPICSRGLASCSLRFTSNEELSQARAESVKKLLDSRLGTTGRTRAEGYGADYPIANNETSEGRARNRRVEISIRQAAQEPLNRSGGEQ